MTTIEAVQNDADNIRAAMTRKGLAEANLRVSISSDAAPSAMATWTELDRFGKSNKYKHLSGGNAAELIDKGWEWVNTLPSVEERAHTEYAKAVARAIELGREHGVENELVNPLREAMERLSKNALVDMRVLEVAKLAETDDIPF